MAPGALGLYTAEWHGPLRDSKISVLNSSVTKWVPGPDL